MAVQVIPNPTLGVGVWLIWGAYLLVVLLLVLRQFLGQWGLSIRSSTSPRRAQRTFSSQTLLDYFTDDEFVGPTKLACVLISPVILAPVIVNTPNDIYTNGFSAFAWLPAILFGVLGYMLVAARLSKLSTIRGYSSPVDFLNDRFRSRTMRAVSGFAMVLSSVMFMAILMKAAGSFISVLSGDSISALSGAIGVGAAVLCFELLGGLSSVGLIDIMHVAIMMFSFLLMYILQSALFGGFAQVLKTISATNSVIADSPAAESHLAWILWTIPFIAFPLYPHLMPRLQGYHSSKGLRFALVMLSLIPFVILPGMLAFGFSGRSLFPNLPLFNTSARQTSADIFALTIRVVMTQGSGYYFLGSMFFVGSMSVVMSTTSCSVSGASAVIALDLYRPLVGSGSSVHVGRIISVVSTLFLLAFAVVLSEVRLLSTTSLIGMINGVLLQLMPAFLLGLYSHFEESLTLNIGMASGILSSMACHLGFTLNHSSLPADLGALIGLIVNASIVYSMSLFLPSDDQKPEQESKKEGSVSDGFSLGLSQEASVEAPMKHKSSFGKFKSAMPSGLVGWRLVSNLDIAMDLNELSVSDGSIFSSGSFAVDHARIGTTTLGSIGRIGDGNTEPIHNPVLLGASALFLILSSPFYFSTTSAGVSTNGIPFWIYLSFFSALMASATLVYILFSSWDVKSISSDSCRELSMDVQSVSSRVENSIEGVMVQNEPSTTMESVPVSQPAITRFSSKALNPFGRFSRTVANDSETQNPQQKSPEFNFGKSDRAEKPKFSSFGKRSFNPGPKPEKQDRSIPSADFGSELGSFSLEEEIRQYRYR